MIAQEITIKIKSLTANGAQNKAQYVEQIANNLDMEALKILATKSKKPGMSDKVKKFKNLM